MIPLLIIAFFLGLFGLITWVAVRQSKRAAGNFQRMAETLGLQFVSSPPKFGMFYPAVRATGQVRGRSVEVFSFSTGAGKSRTPWCAVSAAVSGSGLTFHLRPQGLGTKVMEMLGAKEISVGDAEFDRAWFIQTNQPDYFRAALLPELREKINALLRESGTRARGLEFKLEQGVVRYAEIGSFSGADQCKRCERAVDIVCDLAEVAEVAAESQAGS